MRDVDMQKTTNNNLFYRWGPALVVMGIIFLISSFPSHSVPNYGVFDILVKKSGHFLGYAALGLAYCHALGVDHPTRGRIAWVLAVLYAISDEYHQSFVPGRSAWIVDILIDALGSVFGILGWYFFNRKSF
jgi:VanZ family protein